MRVLSPSMCRLGLAAGLAIAIMASLPGNAAATCGDYVTIEGPATDSRLPPVPMPCHGPSCSKAPAAPVLPATVPAIESHDLKSSTESMPHAADSGPGWDVPVVAHNRAARLAFIIFHPPRRAVSQI